MSCFASLITSFLLLPGTLTVGSPLSFSTVASRNRIRVMLTTVLKVLLRFSAICRWMRPVDGRESLYLPAILSYSLTALLCFALFFVLLESLETACSTVVYIGIFLSVYSSMRCFIIPLFPEGASFRYSPNSFRLLLYGILLTLGLGKSPFATGEMIVL